jgi:Kef-type K+ transport system membrane component KefB
MKLFILNASHHHHTHFTLAPRTGTPMTNIEIIVILLLLFMGVPDLCRKLHRPALAYPIFILFGIAVGPLLAPGVQTMLQQAGHIGFLLLLFEVGLEIDLPPARQFLRDVRTALGYSLLQYPVVIAFASHLGLDFTESLLASIALTGCSVGMAHAAWKVFPGLRDEERTRLLAVMVALEMITIVGLALSSTALKVGLSWWIGAKFVGMCAAVVLIARFAAHFVRAFQTILDKTTHWRLHWIVLLVLVICAAGERLGLDAAKTAFFLGLFMSRARHDGLNLEECIAPLSRRFLIPIFFVSLGLAVQWNMLVSLTCVFAFGVAGVLLGVKEVLHRRGFRLAADTRAFVLLSPNLTMVALGVRSLLEVQPDSKAAIWLLLTGLFVTVMAILLTPPGREIQTAPTPKPVA